MGKYKQWLDHRDLDQQLRTQLATLKKELSSLQEQTRHLEDDILATPMTTNSIIQALHQEQTIFYSTPEQHIFSRATPEPSIYTTEPSNEPLAPEILSWGSLPNFDSLQVQEAMPSSLPATPQPGIGAHEYTAPQDTLPGWLRNLLQTSDGPVDPQTERTNKLVERWMARWGKQPLPSSESPQSLVEEEEEQRDE